MAGRKRTAAEDSGPRATKAVKTEAGGKKAGSGARTRKAGGPKATLTASAFKARALPLHVHITHTPPVADVTSITNANDDSAKAKDKDSEEEGKERVPVTTADPGAICSATLLPTVFGTGSYGWKGSRRVAIRVPAREVGVDVVDADGTGAEEGDGEMVTVMISINATVLGSKKVKDKDAAAADANADAAEGSGGAGEGAEAEGDEDDAADE